MICRMFRVHLHEVIHMYTLGSFTWCWGHVSIYSAPFGDNWLRTQSFWWHHILKQSLYLSAVTSISCRSVIPQGAHTICWCSRLLFYSKCTGLTNAYQVFFISYYFTICLTTSNKKRQSARRFVAGMYESCYAFQSLEYCEVLIFFEG